MAHIDRVRRVFERARSLAKDECARLKDTAGDTATLPDGAGTMSELCTRLDVQNREALDACVSRPVVVALEGSFHGKSSAALKVTHNEGYRVPFQGLSAIATCFIDPKRPDQLRAVVENSSVHFQYPSISDGRVTIRKMPVNRAFAFILEPIRGEGGIHVVPNESMADFARLHSELKVPFIIDEIQTGCGRTGSIFCFKQTPLAMIEPEYVVLSKALGGGLVKIGATLIKKSVYNEDFGLLHSSTFAEDDLACYVASASLDLLTRNDGGLLRRVVEIGDYMWARLEGLQRRHPTSVAEVRGKGLMLGLELKLPAGCSRFLAEAGRQGVLPFLIASYVHHHFRIRLMPPLGCALTSAQGAARPPTLRLQPPLTVTRDEVDRLIVALDEVLTIIERNNEYCLVSHLWDHCVPPAERQNPRSFAPPSQKVADDEQPDARVGFIIHPTDIEQIVSYFMPSLAHYGWDRKEVERWWNAVARFLDPVLVHTARIRSRGRKVDADLVLVPNLPSSMIATTPSRRTEVSDKVAAAVRIAARPSEDKTTAKIVGLGGYTSIVTGCGRSLPDCNVPITTGNAYTAGLVIEAVQRAATKQGVELATSTVAVVGACGNIGMVLAEALAPRVERMMLIGRPNNSGRLRLAHARRACIKEILRVLGPAGCSAGRGNTPLAAPLRQARSEQGTAIQECEDVDPGGGDGLRPDVAPVLETELATGLTAIAISCDIDSIREADVVVVATNSPDLDLIRPSMLKRDAILCCASVPSNVSRDVAVARPDCFVFAGGLADRLRRPPGRWPVLRLSGGDLDPRASRREAFLWQGASPSRRGRANCDARGAVRVHPGPPADGSGCRGGGLAAEAVSGCRWIRCEGSG
jgi:acetylornithine/succinyldiaminopimelate/putrescine aminotransferase/predicted amino acid dehydrogenase